MLWLYRNALENDNDVRFYGDFTPIFFKLEIDLGKGKSLPDIANIPAIELVIPELTDGELYDNITVPPAMGMLVSSKLKALFDQAGVNNIQWLPTKISRSDGNIVTEDYVLGNIVGLINAADMKKSDVVLHGESGRIKFIDKLVLRDDLGNLRYSIFRMNEFKPIRIVTDNLKLLIENAGCTGIKFLEPGELTL